MWSTLALGAMGGSLIAGKFADMVGRKIAILCNAVPFSVGAVLMSFWVSYAGLIIGRLVVGFAVGYSSVLVPVFISEIAPPHLRGLLGTINQLSIASGITLVNIVGIATVDNSNFWKVLMMLSLILVGIQFFGILLFAPETPRWLVDHNRIEDARVALRRLRGPTADVDAELDCMRSGMPERTHRSAGSASSPLLDDEVVDMPSVARDHDRLVPRDKSSSHDDSSQSVWEAVLEPVSRRTLLVGFLLMLLQQWSGINAFVLNTKSLFIGDNPDTEPDGRYTHSVSMKALQGAIIVNIVQVVFTGISTVLVDRLGRRVLLLTSASGQAVVCLVMGFVYYTNQGEGLKITIVLIYYALFAIGLGPIPWVVCGEIFPMKTRGILVSLCTVLNWTSAFVVTLTFNKMNSAFSTSGTFWFYGAICLVGSVAVFFKVPETKGKSLDEVQQLFAKKY